ncbi:hypothetical protein BGZ63DRAFT_401393 [Mariannaea sp. PMI_226]|nr:hypothetical protein BGZ63DRAFT_401393 [Mariannaea sp. PMI_226]
MSRAGKSGDSELFRTFASAATCIKVAADISPTTGFDWTREGGTRLHDIVTICPKIQALEAVRRLREPTIFCHRQVLVPYHRIHRQETNRLAVVYSQLFCLLLRSMSLGRERERERESKSRARPLQRVSRWKSRQEDVRTEGNSSISTCETRYALSNHILYATYAFIKLLLSSIDSYKHAKWFLGGGSIMLRSELSTGRVTALDLLDLLPKTRPTRPPTAPSPIQGPSRTTLVQDTKMSQVSVGTPLLPTAHLSVLGNYLSSTLRQHQERAKARRRARLSERENRSKGYDLVAMQGTSGVQQTARAIEKENRRLSEENAQLRALLHMQGLNNQAIEYHLQNRSAMQASFSQTPIQQPVTPGDTSRPLQPMLTPQRSSEPRPLSAQFRAPASFMSSVPRLPNNRMPQGTRNPDIPSPRGNVRPHSTPVMPGHQSSPPPRSYQQSPIGFQPAGRPNPPDLLGFHSESNEQSMFEHIDLDKLMENSPPFPILL